MRGWNDSELWNPSDCIIEGYCRDDRTEREGGWGRVAVALQGRGGSARRNGILTDQSRRMRLRDTAALLDAAPLVRGGQLRQSRERGVDYVCDYQSLDDNSRDFDFHDYPVDRADFQCNPTES